jgi:PPOX class probable F420-dependent enzyme
MAAEIKPEFAARIQSSQFTWFATVREDGMPQPTPVWFIEDGDDFIIYSTPQAQKIKNIQKNPNVAMSFSWDDEAESYVVVMGQARVDPSIPSPIKHSAYFTKYQQGITDIGMTPTSFEQTFSTGIRVTPISARGNLE